MNSKFGLCGIGMSFFFFNHNFFWLFLRPIIYFSTKFVGYFWGFDSTSLIIASKVSAVVAAASPFHRSISRIMIDLEHWFSCWFSICIINSFVNFQHQFFCQFAASSFVNLQHWLFCWVFVRNCFCGLLGTLTNFWIGSFFTEEFRSSLCLAIINTLKLSGCYSFKRLPLYNCLAEGYSVTFITNASIHTLCQ